MAVDKKSSAPPPVPQSSFGALVRTSLAMLVAMTLLTGVFYPLVVTGIAKAAFPERANGSLVVRDGNVVGSRLLGQPLEDPGHFWGRLSATAPAYNGASSTGSNLGPTNPALKNRAEERIAALRKADPGNTAPVPVDLVTASASGLDPDISPAAAAYQVRRVARARGMREGDVRALVAQYTEGRSLGIFGEPRVNVLLLNLALDRR